MSRFVTDIGLPDICSLVTDGTHDSPKLQPMGVPFIKGKHISSGRVDFESCDFITEEDHQKCIKRVKPQLDDVLFTNIGSVGDVARVVDEREFSIKNVALFRPNPSKVDPNYFYYLVTSPRFRGVFLNVRSGSAQPFISLEAFRSHQFPFITDKVQQHQIGGILSAYDDLIENNRRRMVLMEDAARQLYQEWFGRLRFPGFEHTRIVKGVPVGWERMRIGNVADCIGGGTPSTAVSAYWDDGDVTWVTPADVTRNQHFVLLDSEKKITEGGLKNSSARLVPPHAVLMTSRASVGFFAVMNREVCTNQGFISVVPNDPILSTYILFHLSERVEEIRSMGSGSTYPEVSRGKFREFEVLIPRHTLISAFDEQATLLLKQIRILKQQNQKLRSARDLLLPRLMNGEIAV